MSIKKELWLAVEKGDVDRIRLLVKQGVNVNMHSRWLYGLPGRTALHVAVKYGQMESARVLLELGADVNAVDVTQDGTPLVLAVYEGNIAMLKLLLANGANPNVNHSRVGMLAFKYPILHTALWIIAKEECAVVLINEGADITVTDSSGNTPLHIAAKYGRVKAIQALLNRGADTEARNKKRDLPIQLTDDDSCRQVLINVGK